MYYFNGEIKRVHNIILFKLCIINVSIINAFEIYFILYYYIPHLYHQNGLKEQEMTDCSIFLYFLFFISFHSFRSTSNPLPAHVRCDYIAPAHVCVCVCARGRYKCVCHYYIHIYLSDALYYCFEPAIVLIWTCADRVSTIEKPIIPSSMRIAILIMSVHKLT